MSPLAGRLIDRLVPWYASVISVIGHILSQAIQTGAGGNNVAAVVIATLGLDLFRQSEQVALTTAVFQYVTSPNITSNVNASSEQSFKQNICHRAFAFKRRYDSIGTTHTLLTLPRCSQAELDLRWSSYGDVRRHICVFEVRLACCSCSQQGT